MANPFQPVIDELNERKARITALEAENAAIKARNAELVEGLRPMADALDEVPHEDAVLADDLTVWECSFVAMALTFAHLRRARALLQGGSDA